MEYVVPGNFEEPGHALASVVEAAEDAHEFGMACEALDKDRMLKDVAREYRVSGPHFLRITCKILALGSASCNLKFLQSRLLIKKIHNVAYELFPKCLCHAAASFLYQRLASSQKRLY